ncbi:hypothetical protein YSA_00892 [Pseudomonas putida ND6]|uniref:Uncharacterized protein n=1 Tax=Pseudomonas putida ND6 TaxID=231023 RepID=I3UP38_PSEPU|nr:hypothetical protein YSA_00892 [Pseudomonas putida ND6]
MILNNAVKNDRVTVGDREDCLNNRPTPAELGGYEPLR